MGYAGDISVNEAWALLKGDPKAQLVDVRTAAEWTFVGLPDLSQLGRTPILVELQTFPDMRRNGEFDRAVQERLQAAGAGEATPVVFLCRSGGRSQAAARALTAMGFSKCFNVAGGFEGDLDARRHRGTANGWKAAGLPWTQS